MDQVQEFQEFAEQVKGKPGKRERQQGAALQQTKARQGRA